MIIPANTVNRIVKHIPHFTIKKSNQQIRYFNSKKKIYSTLYWIYFGNWYYFADTLDCHKLFQILEDMYNFETHHRCYLVYLIAQTMHNYS